MSQTGRHLGLAALVLAGSMGVVFSPLLVDLGGLNKYVVALGLFGVCIGVSFALHAVIDLLVGRR